MIESSSVPNGSTIVFIYHWLTSGVDKLPPMVPSDIAPRDHLHSLFAEEVPRRPHIKRT
jgi:hypothetical protein